MSRLRSIFTFPEIVNEKAARTVAGGVVIMSLATILLQQKWILVPIAYGFWARVLSGPTLSPLGQLATRVVAPRLGTPELVPGPPKRFAQAIGVLFSTSALVIWFGAGDSFAASIVVGLLAIAAFLESALAICLGCKVFNLLMQIGIIPESVCEACADISRLHPPAA